MPSARAAVQVNVHAQFSLADSLLYRGPVPSAIVLVKVGLHTVDNDEQGGKELTGTEVLATCVTQVKELRASMASDNGWSGDINLHGAQNLPLGPRKFSPGVVVKPLHSQISPA